MTMRLIVGLAIGSAVGALMGYFGKCTSGMCPLTANPLRGAIWGALVGALFAFSFGCGTSESKQEAAQPRASSEISKPAQEKETEGALVYINSESDFGSRVLKAKLPCLVDFFSLRCPPCRILGPTIKKLAEKYKGKAVVCKLSLDHAETRGLAQRYGIRAIPTVIFFSKGKETQRLVGLRNEEEYSTVLDEMLKAAQ